MKENTLFKLDLLQAYYLQKPARFGVTKQMLRSEKYQTNSKLKNKNKNKNKHKLLQLTRNEAFEMIKRLQYESFEKKIHFIEGALYRVMVKILKKEKQRLNNKNNEDIIKIIDELLLKDSKVLEANIKHKIFKILLNTFPEKVNIKDDKFEGIPELSIEYIKNMKDNNPYKTNGNALNNLLSKIYGDKTVAEVMENIKGLEIIWGPKKYSKDKNDNITNADIDQKENDIEYRSRNSGSESDLDDADEKVKINNDDDYEKLYDGYKDYIVASSDEEDQEELNLDPSINYNEVTDEEPSDDNDDDDDDDDDELQEKESKRHIEDDDFFTKEQPKTKKTKLRLPNLATGYYSGGESDIEHDDLVNEITEPRKNRRGQRARQKIWEKKYGKGAKHVVKEQERNKSERERLRLEYEARKAKRDEKAKLKEAKNKEKAERKETQKEKDQALHPSWAAKLKAQENLKAKFAGKKITFD